MELFGSARASKLGIRLWHRIRSKKIISRKSRTGPWIPNPSIPLSNIHSKNKFNEKLLLVNILKVISWIRGTFFWCHHKHLSVWHLNKLTYSFKRLSLYRRLLCWYHLGLFFIFGLKNWLSQILPFFNLTSIKDGKNEQQRVHPPQQHVTQPKLQVHIIETMNMTENKKYRFPYKGEMK